MAATNTPQKLFRRAFTASIGTLSTDALRVQFKIKKTLKKEPNTCDLRITGLAKASRDKLTGAGVPIVVEAGYEGSTAICFSGDSRTIDHTHNRIEWVTHAQCGDGEQQYRYARISESHAPGKSLKDALRSVADKLGLNKGNLEAALKGNLSFEQFTHGFAAFGSASGVLDSLAKSAGLDWSIQNGQLQFTSPDLTKQQTSAFLLSASSGLIGSPDHAPPDHKQKPAVLKCRSFLNGQLAPGKIVTVQSDAVHGEFVIQQVEHVGDSEGDEWHTEIESIARS